MRDIEFRQWTGKEFIVWGVGVDECTFVGPVSGSGINAQATVHQQFTGLQDVNGVDIYEGDIVSHADSQVWTVEFSDNEAAFIVYNQLNSNRRLQSSFGDHYSVDDDNVMNMAAVFNIASREESPCKITGNIYQNPELLR
jgi:uncharacterized phage protein (TIGR01671 family)